MAKKKEEVKPPLFLHCKCDQCTNWEIVYDQKKAQYYIVCASCPEKIPVYFSIDVPHPSLHWEDK